MSIFYSYFEKKKLIGYLLILGEIALKMKGCFTHNTECMNTECVDHAQIQEKKINFCCCKGNLCNADFKWVPTTTVATEVEG